MCDLVICFSEDTNEKSLDRNNLMFTEIGILARLIGIRNFGYNDYKPVDGKRICYIKILISHIVSLAPLRFNAVLCRQLTASNINK